MPLGRKDVNLSKIGFPANLKTLTLVPTKAMPLGRKDVNLSKIGFPVNLRKYKELWSNDVPESVFPSHGNSFF